MSPEQVTTSELPTPQETLIDFDQFSHEAILQHFKSWRGIVIEPGKRWDYTHRQSEYLDDLYFEIHKTDHRIGAPIEQNRVDFRSRPLNSRLDAHFMGVTDYKMGIGTYEHYVRFYRGDKDYIEVRESGFVMINNQNQSEISYTPPTPKR